MTLYYTPFDPGDPLDASEINSRLTELNNEVAALRSSGTTFPTPAEGKLHYYTTEKMWYIYADGDWRPLTYIRNIEIPIDGGGSAITSGEKWPGIRIPWNCEILEWYLVADQSGSISIDLQVDTFANFPPTVADSIVASAPPALSSAQTDTDSTLTGWTTQLSEGDWMRVYVDSATTVTWVNLVLVVALNDGS